MLLSLTSVTDLFMIKYIITLHLHLHNDIMK